MNETSQCWRAQTQKHRLRQQHTFTTVSSVITDWITLLVIHIEHVIFPQIRFVMKSYSFIRETAPLVMNNPPKEGTGHFWWQIIWAQNWISQLYVCVCLFVCFKEKIPDSQHCPAICTSSSAQRWSTGNHTPGRISWTPHVHDSFALLCLLVNPNNLLTQTDGLRAWNNNAFCPSVSGIPT